MLDSMMSASGLSLAEQRRLRNACEAGPSVQMAPRHRPLPVGRKPKFQDPLQGVAINPLIARSLPGGGGRVTQANILRAHGGSLERAQYQSGPAAASADSKKEGLQNLMTYGTTQLPPPKHGRRAAVPGAAAPRPQPERSAESMLRGQIADEIAERQEFLETMRAMGKGAEHEAKLTGEIAERMQDLKALDRLESGAGR